MSIIRKISREEGKEVNDLQSSIRDALGDAPFEIGIAALMIFIINNSIEEMSKEYFLGYADALWDKLSVQDREDEGVF